MARIMTYRYQPPTPSQIHEMSTDDLQKLITLHTIAVVGMITGLMLKPNAETVSETTVEDVLNVIKSVTENDA